MTNTLKPDDRLEMTFVVTDEKAGEGMAFGNAGTADLRVARGYHGLNFFEVTLVGNVMLATIVLPDQLPVAAVAPQAKYPNVYSRHTVMDAFVDGGTETRGELVPSQYLGECTLKN